MRPAPSSAPGWYARRTGTTRITCFRTQPSRTGPDSWSAGFLVYIRRWEGGRNRWLVEFSEFARIDCPGLWDHRRNPVRYTTLKELGINPSALKWEPMPKPVLAKQLAGKDTDTRKTGVRPLTMAEAKMGLALTFKVPPEAIEITIRG